jgi:predicted amino acid racemase
MIPPQFSPWMEKLNQFSIDRVKTSQIGSFVPIAMQTSESQIVQFREATVLAWSDVIDVKSERKGLGR